MATQATIGKSFTFDVLFLDEVNVPVIPVNPTIDVFMYNNGSKVDLVTAAPMLPVDPPEPGRYVYVYALPLSLVDGDNIHAEMKGIDSGSGLLMYARDVVVAKSPVGGLGYGGLTARFIK